MSGVLFVVNRRSPVKNKKAARELSFSPQQEQQQQQQQQQQRHSLPHSREGGKQGAAPATAALGKRQSTCQMDASLFRADAEEPKNCLIAVSE